MATIHDIAFRDPGRLSAAFLALVVLLMAILHAAYVSAEDLKTLDGKTYTNFVYLSNASTVAIIKHSEGLSGVQFSNLPNDFLAKNGLPTNGLAARAAGQPNPIDMFLARFPDSDFKVEKILEDPNISTGPGSPSTQSWIIRVTTKGFQLAACKWWQGPNGVAHTIEMIKAKADGQRRLADADLALDLATISGDKSRGQIGNEMAVVEEFRARRRARAITEAAEDDEDAVPARYSKTLVFDLGQEIVAGSIFEKFIDWEGKASANNAESFKKIMVRCVDIRSNTPRYHHEDEPRIFTFNWEKDSTPGSGARATLDDSHARGFGLQKADIVHFNELLKSLPAIKEELAKKIRKQQEQNELFK